jgi:hypothetical protein
VIIKPQIPKLELANIIGPIST